MAIVTDFDQRLALFLARCCRETYTQYENNGNFTIPRGYKLVSNFKAQIGGVSEWFGFVIRSAANIVLAFRGSASFLDWLTDADFSQTNFPYAAGKAKTHTGFTAIYASCREQLLATFTQLDSTAELYITGRNKKPT